MDKKIEILKYWFSGLNDESTLSTDLPQFRKWFGKAEETDQEIRDRFLSELLECFYQWQESQAGTGDDTGSVAVGAEVPADSAPPF